MEGEVRTDSRTEGTCEHMEGAGRRLDASVVADSEEASEDILLLQQLPRLLGEWVEGASCFLVGAGNMGHGGDTAPLQGEGDSVQIHDERQDQAHYLALVQPQGQAASVHLYAVMGGLLREDAPDGRSYCWTIPRSLFVVETASLFI